MCNPYTPPSAKDLSWRDCSWCGWFTPCVQLVTGAWSCRSCLPMVGILVAHSEEASA